MRPVHHFGAGPRDGGGAYWLGVQQRILSKRDIMREGGLLSRWWHPVSTSSGGGKEPARFTLPGRGCGGSVAERWLTYGKHRGEWAEEGPGM